jgi:hypothetical protein
MQYVEIQLDGVIAVKRCPILNRPDGFPDYGAIRAYFSDLGYTVGQYLRLR